MEGLPANIKEGLIKVVKKYGFFSISKICVVRNLNQLQNFQSGLSHKSIK
jgi:hypothetical protein